VVVLSGMEQETGVIGAYFIHEPRGQVYRDLLAALAPLADRALLVVRTYTQLSNDGERVLEQMSRWHTLEEERSDWPGTHLLGSTASIYEYAICREAIAILQSTVEGLYEWQAPLPEDLAFLRADRSVILYSTGHEEDGGLSLHPSERDALLRECPGIIDCVEWKE